MGDDAIPQLILWLKSSERKSTPPKDNEKLNQFYSLSHNLKILNLSSNKLSDKCIFDLCEGLITANPPLNHLDLSENQMETQGCKSLGEFLQVNSHIKILRLQWNKIHSEGA
mmetsp:Transcript_3408/g.3157  ORF Transcript_3408/g.3157 Transcript_3408/m.3157 type:complete len:112 (+) Transcript_3408:234-569(+)